MTPSVLSALLLLACALPFNSAQCDSCKGRCGESFKRGRQCDCDPDCARYSKCCPDYKSQCGIEVFTTTSTKPASTTPKTSSCNNVIDNKPKEPEPPQIQPNEEPEMTPNPQEELNEDDQFMPLVTPEPELQDEQGDDIKGETWPDLPVPSPEAEQEAILEGDYTPFPEELDPEATPGQEGTPPAEANLNPYLAEPAKVVPTETADSSVPEGQPDSSSSPSALDTTPPGSFSEPTSASDQVFPSSEPQPGPTPAEDTLELLSEGQSELDPEGQEAESENTLPKDSEPTPSNLENAATTPASDPTSTSPTQGTEDPEATPASLDSTTPPTKPDQTPSATKGDTPSSEQDSSKENEAPASESGPEAKPGRGDTPDSFDDSSVPQTGDLATPPTSDPQAASTDPTEHEEKGDEAAPEETTTDPMKLTLVLTIKPTPNKTTEKPKPSKPTGKPKPSPTRPSTLTDINQDLGTDNPRDYQADEHNDTNICSGRPVGAVTTLRNGTVVVFRGHYFWVLDSNRVPGPARGITDVWGVPSPIDTVFTRCNCQGKTYFFKGSNYWRFENGMMEPGYPKLIRVGFDGLQGQITAALSVPEYRKRRESVYFFKRGGLVQKYSYQSGISPTCGRKVHYSVHTVRNRVARQAVPLLGQEINIRLSWRGFPSTVTSAVSIPTHRKPEGYNYYLFSRSKYYNVNMGDERPFIATPPVSSAPQKNSAKDFFNCPKEV
ncbi:proteoglycan 4b isoform X3 [Salvelinus namaycush]|uniref:Proteoglycan 4b isoform X3 n=1 Tax=Salvelinus namaycush TaxID=8040 RepID=A0A8U1BQD2_SALNM|nr:proteoglycan 4b isoform X3 [Salvelinus namaycush]